MTPFEKALIQAVNDDFSHVPPEEELDFAPIPMKKGTKTRTLRRCLLVAAVCALLVGGALAAYAIRYPIGEVTVETDISKILPIQVDEEYANNNRYYNLTFTEEILFPNAPETIETFYLPTYGVSADTLSLPNCYISNTNGVYRPFANLYFVHNGDDEAELVTHEGLMPNPSQENIAKILAAPTCAGYQWVEDHVETSIYFDQYPAKRVSGGMGFNLVFPADSPKHPSWETIEIDEYSIFTFNIDYDQESSSQDSEARTIRHWYWSNGEYLFYLIAQGTMEEMTELFRSVKPVSTEYPYEAGEDQIAENFTLVED